MSTKKLLTLTSLCLALAGLAALFAPESVLAQFNADSSASMLVQLLGALYFALALMNWTARDSAIGGVYARPVSLANFSYFLSASLTVLKSQLDRGFSPLGILLLAIHILFLICYYWLVFRATGLTRSPGGS